MTPDANNNTDKHTAIAAETKILIVEDNKIDAKLMRHALHQMADWPCSIQVVDDGEKALKFLRREGAFQNAERPDLIILDLNLPKYTGSEILQYIRTSQDLQSIPVFIFSSSPVDVAAERIRGANIKADSYFEKPNHFHTYADIANQMRDAYYRALEPDYRVAIA